MTDEVLSKYIAETTLISIKRESIASGTLQAFAVAFSPTLLCCWYVRDFLRDGYLFLRRADITSMECRATDRFQRRLMDDSGLLPSHTNTDRFDLDSFPALLDSLADTEIAIVECESADEDVFTIGRYAGMDADDFLAIHEFSGAANWDDDLTRLAIEDVTCVQLRSNYILPYQRYFDQTGYPSIPEGG